MLTQKSSQLFCKSSRITRVITKTDAENLAAFDRLHTVLLVGADGIEKFGGEGAVRDLKRDREAMADWKHAL